MTGAFDRKDQAALEAFAAELQEIYGGALLAVAVTGEAASASYRAGRTPLETLVVVRELTPATLRAARSSLGRWARKRIPTPLFLDPAYLAGASDTFPLELLELAHFHVLLFGDDAFFDSIRIERASLRHQVEEQLRGKLLHLWEHYLVWGGRRRRLERLLLEALPDFEVALRGLLCLRHPEPTGESRRRAVGVELLGAVSEELSMALPTLSRLEAIRLDGARIPDRDLDAIFEDALTELRAIVAWIDRL